jgi:hypothetical protein
VVVGVSIMIIPDFFNENGLKIIETIKSRLNENKQWANSEDENRAYMTGFSSNENKILAFMMREKIIDLIGEYEIRESVIMNAQIPWDIHSDYNNPELDMESTPGWGILVPLETVNTHTIIFNEKCKTSMADFKKNNKKMDQINEDMYEKYFSHCSLDNTKYVSINKICKWTYNHAIIWNKEYLHCSDNFHKNNIKTKSALVIFIENI